MLISGIQRFTMLDFPDRTAAIVFTPGCNMRCKFCHNKEFVLPEEIRKIQHSFLDEEAVLRFLATRKGLLDGVVISGGEPTIQPDLIPFIHKVRDLGFLVKLDSNGNRPDILRDVIDQELVDYIAMDVKTSLDTYQELVGAMAHTDKIAESIALLKKHRVPYEFRVTLIKEFHTPEILADMAQLLDGAHALYLQSFRSANTLDPTWKTKHPFTPDELVAIRDQFAQTVDNVFVR
jgi:pyruvate formate lyase activating enzyme